MRELASNYCIGLSFLVEEKRWTKRADGAAISTSRQGET